MEGALSKWTNVVNGWQYRWFVLDDNSGLFSYYTSKEKRMRGIRRGCVRLSGAILGIDDEDDSTFTITVDGKTFHFQAQDSEERERWIRALEDTVVRHNQSRHRSLKKKISSGIGVVKVEDFDRKLAETDIYLQLLLNQISVLRQKMENPDLSAEGRESYNSIIDKAVNMTESIKHSIVLLQIAKNASLPQDGAGIPKLLNRSATSSVSGGSIIIDEIRGQASSGSPPVTSSTIFNHGLVHVPIEEGIRIGAECIEAPSLTLGDSAMSSTVMLGSSVPSRVKIPVVPTPKMLKSSAIPEISYSSSDDDDFFDAEDEGNAVIVEEEGSDGSANSGDETQVTSSSAKYPAESPSSRSRTASTTDGLAHSPVAIASGDYNSAANTDQSDFDDNVDYDALYENADEDLEKDVDMNSHGSVITHLLSQVRIGMDLTKIVLPTFILERRSLLEMYADFFAHPDIFLDIADGKDPEERMIRVLRWYLSSFHAGRKSTVAKKPYNPILGETFRCHWKTDSFTKSNDSGAASSTTYPSPPKPWTPSENITADDLTFVAEQVSHHPPISAFYAEHIKKRIAVNAHIYTKSSFLGMSVAVHNVGQGAVHLLDLDEEYIATFPSGYGRSILTVPWIELGGKVQIQCPKTGYVANLEFKCKPFFSSEVNKVTAEVFPPGSKKAVVRIDGEWNGKLMAKYASGCNEIFMDVSKIPIHKKICRSVVEQEPYESRRLWREVTRGLTVNDIEAATNAKYALEQRQREEALQRKESNQTWETKLFRPIGENWFFDQPLSTRVMSKN